jgi:DNA invertase Pin-like site-specific DNA recombinase
MDAVIYLRVSTKDQATKDQGTHRGEIVELSGLNFQGRIVELSARQATE